LFQEAGGVIVLSASSSIPSAIETAISPTPTIEGEIVLEYNAEIASCLGRSRNIDIEKQTIFLGIAIATHGIVVLQSQ
jgi:hypothetical protein